MSVLTVEVVSPEKRVWSGEAKMVSTRTLEGDLRSEEHTSELQSH